MSVGGDRLTMADPPKRRQRRQGTVERVGNARPHHFKISALRKTVVAVPVLLAVAPLGLCSPRYCKGMVTMTEIVTHEIVVESSVHSQHEGVC